MSLIQEKMYQNKIPFYYLELFFTISIFSGYNSENLYYSYITLRVSTTGISKIYNNSTQATKPDEIYIDNKLQQFNLSYILTPENIVKLVWYNNITGCSWMFSSCTSIVEMNLTYFDTSKCQNMESMFRNCKSIISLDLSSFDTSGVSRFADMFNNCESLIYLNLSNLT